MVLKGTEKMPRILKVGDSHTATWYGKVLQWYWSGLYWYCTTLKNTVYKGTGVGATPDDAFHDFVKQNNLTSKGRKK